MLIAPVASRHLSHMPQQQRARRVLALLALTLAVSIAHLLASWGVPSPGKMPEFKPSPGTPTLITRQVSAPSRVAPVPEPAAPSARPPAPPTARQETATASGSPTASPTLPAGLPPDPGTKDRSDEGALHYTVTGRFGGQLLGGSAKLEWKVVQSAYALSLTVTGSHRFSTLFAWQHAARGRITAEGPRPDDYEETLSLLGQNDARREVSFSAPQPALGFGATTQTPTAGADPLTALLQLAMGLETAAATPAEGAAQPALVTVNLAEGSFTLSFEREGDEVVESPFGPLPVIKLVSREAGIGPGGTVISLWLAPELRYAPVRVQVDSQGVTFVTLDLASEPTALPLR